MAASTLVRAMVVGFDPPEAHIAGGFVVPERLWTPRIGNMDGSAACSFWTGCRL
jgi:hypothetical protein